MQERRLATVEQGGAVRLRDAATGRESPVPEAVSGSSASVAFGHDGCSLAVGDRLSGAVTVWDVRSPEEP